MTSLKYKIIKTRAQYDEYCALLERLVFQDELSKDIEDEVELLTLLIEKYDKEHTVFPTIDPIRLLKSLMEDHEMKPKDLVSLLGVSKGLVSDILNYKKGLSKGVIRKLADHFKMDQAAFNRPYPLKRGISYMNNRNKRQLN